MKATIYIDKSLTPRYSVNGWPDKPNPSSDFFKYTVDGVSAYTYAIADKLYSEALEKAKADSVPFELPVYAIHGDFMDMDLKPDTFIEMEIGEVTVGWQWRPYDTSPWQNTNEYYATTVRCGGNPCAQVRKVAQTKDVPDSAAHGYTEGASYPLQSIVRETIGQSNVEGSDMPIMKGDPGAKEFFLKKEEVRKSLSREERDGWDVCWNYEVLPIMKELGKQIQQLAGAQARIKELEDALDILKNPPYLPTHDLRRERDERLSG